MDELAEATEKGTVEYMSSRTLKFCTSFLVVFGVVAAIFLVLSSPSTLGIESKPACRDHTVVDYLAPFDGFRASSPPPLGELSFGPPSLRLRQVALSRVIVDGRGGFGYAAQLNGQVDSAGRLGWLVTAKLEALTSEGKAKEVSAKRRWRIGTVQSLDGREFSLRIQRRPAFYRYLLQFRLQNGKLLRSYSQYVRSVPQRLQVSMLADKETYHPGDQAIFQVANLGTVGVSYGEGGVVQYFNGSEWIPALSLPSSGKRRAFQLGAGQGGVCEILQIPPDLQPGQYRVEKRIMPLFNGGTQSVFREFKVMP